ncbi:MAG: methyltransferase [Sphingobium sp.]|nr:methyltransferase [Sphingobium sp.]
MNLFQSSDNWRVRWINWRNGIVGNPAFQRFAARFPLTRPIARRRARAIFDRVAGFIFSQILAACVELGVFDRLAAGPVAIESLAEEWAMPVAAADRLMRAAAAIGMTEPVGGGRWALTGDGAALRANAGIVEMIAHHRLLYADLADPVALLRRGGGGGALQRFWHYAGETGQGSADEVAAYSRLMAASQPLVAADVIGAYDFARHQRMLDIGGGEGRFVRSVAAAVPGLALAMFDLPAVAARAADAFAREGLSDRIATHGGDFLAGPIPPGHDLVTLVRVLHDHDDAPAAQLLRNIRAALIPGGRLVIAEPMAETRGAETIGDAYFGLYLWAMGSGRPRSAREIRQMLDSAGFRRSWTVTTPLPINVRVIVAAV